MSLFVQFNEYIVVLIEFPLQSIEHKDNCWVPDFQMTSFGSRTLFIDHILS